MRIAARRIRVSAVLALIVSLGAAGDATPQGASQPDSPTVRIGLTTDRVRARVSAVGGIIIRSLTDDSRIWKKQFAAGIYIVSDVEGGETGLVYRVQVASYAAKDQALAIKAELEELLPEEKTVLVYHPDRRAWRVRIGEFQAREDATALVQRLNDEGYEELWVAEQGRSVNARRRIRLVDDRWRDYLTKYDRVLIQPVQPGRRINVGDRSYRGRIEARVDKAGNLRLINELDMEQYLRGVVPNEMGPGVYPEIEALKAQTVAARTYMISNLGQFAENGYDVCDTPACQVYKGAGTEHPMTDRAIEETRGLVLTFKGKPINAMYTSTCGGHTENGSLIFHTEKGPYLKGVPCYPETEAETRTIQGRAWGPNVTLEDGSKLIQEIVLLELLGIVRPGALNADNLLERCASGDAERWTSLTLARLGKKPKGKRLGDRDLTLQRFATYLAAALGWEERMEMAFNEPDLPYLLAFRDGAAVSEHSRRSIAVLILEGILQPFPDNTLRPQHHPSRGMVLRTLFRVLEFYEGLGRVRAKYRGSEGERLLLEVDDEVTPHSIKPDVSLLRSFRDVSYPAAELPITLGDRVYYRLSDDGAIDVLEVIANQRGVSDDRYFSEYRWEKRYTREEMEKRLKSRLDVGRLDDIRATRHGVSRRVVEIRITGSRGSFSIKGFPIRTALGIRENLFTIDRVRDAKGRVKSFIFTGKGWGHGVGMCQVGSYGMALRGKGYEEILTHYYTGARLTPGSAVIDTRRAADDNRATADPKSFHQP